MHAGCPDVEEAIKWSFPNPLRHGMLCNMAAFRQHCAFGFWKASLVGVGGKAGAAMGQFGRITSVEDLPPTRELVRLVKRAAALNEQGVRAPRPPCAAKRPVRAPADLLAARPKNRKALAAFHGFSPSHKREYIDWITGAKTDATRQRRLATAVAWMAKGQPLGRTFPFRQRPLQIVTPA